MKQLIKKETLSVYGALRCSECKLTCALLEPVFLASVAAEGAFWGYCGYFLGSKTDAFNPISGAAFGLGSYVALGYTFINH